ncbi:hypothetical protein GWK26_02805 [haloarchaeon 3A1-DGR]|nr:hypothetical protein GWK26_02805 [haloarchaeon 3A1-DGR]
MNRRQYLLTSTAALAGLSGCLGETEYTVTDVSIAHTTAPLSLEVVASDAGITVDSPGVLDVRLHNTSETSIDVRSTGTWPFGLLALDPPTERDSGTVLLLSDHYADSEHVEVGENSVWTDNETISRSVDAGASVTERYEIHGDRIYRAGDHTLRGYFEPVFLSYRSGETEEWVPFRSEVVVTITKRSLLP